MDAGGVVVKRPITCSRVGVAFGVVRERQIPGGRVVGAGGVVLERLVTGGRVEYINGAFFQSSYSRPTGSVQVGIWAPPDWIRDQLDLL